MKQFFSNHYQTLAAAGYLVVANVKSETTVFDIVSIVSLVAYSAYKLHVSNKGKILDKDLVLEKQAEMFAEFKKEFKSLQADFKDQEKEVGELRSKLSLATSRSTNIPASAKW